MFPSTQHHWQQLFATYQVLGYRCSGSPLGKVRYSPSSSYSGHARQQACTSDRGQYVGASLDKDRLLSQSIFLCCCQGLTQRSFASPTSRSTCSLLNSSLYGHSQLPCYLFSQQQCFP